MKRALLIFLIFALAPLARAQKQIVQCQWSGQRSLPRSERKIMVKSQAILSLESPNYRPVSVANKPLVGTLVYRISTERDSHTVLAAAVALTGQENVDMKNRRVPIYVYESDDGKGTNAALGLPMMVIGRAEKSFAGMWNFRSANDPSSREKISEVECSSQVQGF